MPSLTDCYSELAAAARLYLLQEHISGSWIATDPETHAYFRAYALEQQQKQATVKVERAPSSARTEPLKHNPRPIERIHETPSIKDTPKEEDQNPSEKLNIRDDRLSEPPQDIKQETTTKKPPKEASKSFVLEPMTQAPPIDYFEIKKVFLEKFPRLTWLETPLSDSQARELLKTSAEIIILTYHESGKSLAFIHHLANAIQQLLGNVEVISAYRLEKENGWEEFLKNKNLRLIITSYAGAQSLPGLMNFFRESPKQGHYFGKIRSCLLSDINTYLREPQLKPPLWQSIQSLLNNGK